MFPRPSRIIVPQYEAPHGLSLVAAAELLGDSKRAVAAQVMDLAVRGVLSIAPQGRGRHVLVLEDPFLASPASTVAGVDERGILNVLFGTALQPGARRELRKRHNRPLGLLLRRPHREAVARLIAAGLVRRRGAFDRFVVFWRKQPTEPTPAAHPLVDQLWGVRDYIDLAEKDRLAMLQSPGGALRESRGDLEVFRLYEKLLPYAVLFGLEKKWMAELDLRARDLPPDVLPALLELPDLSILIDVAEVLDGAGSFLGGLGDIGELLGGLDLPDFGDLIP